MKFQIGKWYLEESHWYFYLVSKNEHIIVQDNPREFAIYNTKDPIVGQDVQVFIKEVDSETARSLNARVIKELFTKLKDRRNKG